MTGRSAPFVAMETDLRKEERVAFTADLCGYSVFEAIGRYFFLWSWCSDRGLEDAPEDSDGYVVPEAVICRFLGPRGVEGILGDGCDALAMGKIYTDGMIYLRGTHKTVSRLRAARQVASAGGRSAADRAAKHGRGDGGRFVAKTTLIQPSSGAGPADKPAASSEIPDPRSQIPDPEDQKTRSARAIQRAPDDSGGSGSRESGSQAQASEEGEYIRQGATALDAVVGVGCVANSQASLTTDRTGHPPSSGPFDHTDAFARGRLAETIYRRVSDARLAVAAEFGLPAQLPFPEISPASKSLDSLRNLHERVREEGASAPVSCDRVVANLIAQAREKRSIEWLAEKAFTSGAWRTAREWMPASAKNKAKQPSARRLPGRAPDIPLEHRAGAAELAASRLALGLIADDDDDDVRAMADDLRTRLAGQRTPPRTRPAATAGPNTEIA